MVSSLEGVRSAMFLLRTGLQATPELQRHLARVAELPGACVTSASSRVYAADLCVRIAYGSLCKNDVPHSCLHGLNCNSPGRFRCALTCGAYMPGKVLLSRVCPLALCTHVHLQVTG